MEKYEQFEVKFCEGITKKLQTYHEKTRFLKLLYLIPPYHFGQSGFEPHDETERGIAHISNRVEKKEFASENNG